MEERRMFAKAIIDSDAFLDMPLSSQALYFHLSMRADDDGFVGNPKKIQRMTGCNQDDLSVLISKNFILPFDSGIIVIKHWHVHNRIQKDRYKPTIYQDEKALLCTENNNIYCADNTMETDCIQNVSNLEPQVRLKEFYFSTNTSSMRVKQFLNNPNASIYFYHKGLIKYTGVMLVGKMEVLTDQESKNMIWRKGDTIFYKGGVTDPDYCVLKFTAQSGRYYCDLKTEDFEI